MFLCSSRFVVVDTVPRSVRTHADRDEQREPAVPCEIHGDRERRLPWADHLRPRRGPRRRARASPTAWSTQRDDPLPRAEAAPERVGGRAGERTSRSSAGRCGGTRTSPGCAPPSTAPSSSSPSAASPTRSPSPTPRPRSSWVRTWARETERLIGRPVHPTVQLPCDEHTRSY